MKQRKLQGSDRSRPGCTGITRLGQFRTRFKFFIKQVVVGEVLSTGLDDLRQHDLDTWPLSRVWRIRGTWNEETTFWLWNVLRATTECTFSTSQLPKAVLTPGVFNILTSTCASRHNGVHFFDISTAKCGLELVCFVHFDLEMCFAPQRRALFRHLNCQMWSGAGVLCTFWLGNVLRATTACTFSTSQLPKVVRTPSALYILTWKCASRHNGVHFFDISTAKSGPNRWCVLCILTWKRASRRNDVQFFISRLASWLRTRRFSEPTFRPSGATNHWKNTVFRDFPTFSRICIFFLLTLSLLLFFLLIFLSSNSFSSTLLSSNLSLLSASSLLCFSSVHVVGSLTSELPSTTLYYKACTTHVPVLLCTTKLAQSTSQYYFVLQSLHKAVPSNTLFYKACTKHVPVLLCTTKLAQSTSQCYFVLQSLHKILASTTLYYKACTKYVPALLCTTQSLHPVLICTTKLAKLLCTTKLAQSTSQYYFVLQSLHKVRSSTTLWYKACKKKNLHAASFLNREAFTHTHKLLHTTSFYTEKLLHTASFHTQQAFTHRTLTHSAFTHGKHLHTHTQSKFF